MKKVAKIENNKVVNVTVQQEDFICDGVEWVASDSAVIGDVYNPETGEFTKPEQQAQPVNKVSQKQFFQQLMVDATINEDEALKAILGQELPQYILTHIETLSASEQFSAKVYFLGSGDVGKTHHFVQGLDLTDSFWEQASEL